MRQAWRARPQDLDAAVRLATRYFEEVAATGDPRYIGYAQAALQPWWASLRRRRRCACCARMLLQFDHRFEPALADLEAALAAEPDNAEAWSWRTAIQMVRADYGGAAPVASAWLPWRRRWWALPARRRWTPPPAAPAGRHHAAPALQRHADARPAPVEPDAAGRDRGAPRRLGAAAEAAFREALALGLPDVYLQAAYADFLLDRGRRPRCWPC
jgi:hypothetical protein